MSSAFGSTVIRVVFILSSAYIASSVKKNVYRFIELIKSVLALHEWSCVRVFLMSKLMNINGKIFMLRFTE